jgi:hypothetical protein
MRNPSLETMNYILEYNAKRLKENNSKISIEGKTDCLLIELV